MTIQVEQPSEGEARDNTEGGGSGEEERRVQERTGEGRKWMRGAQDWERNGRRKEDQEDKFRKPFTTVRKIKT